MTGGGMKACLCPWCGYMSDAASSADWSSDVTPKPGDVSLCLECAGVMVFTPDLATRKANGDDFHKFTPEEFMLIAQMKMAHKQLGRKPRKVAQA